MPCLHLHGRAAAFVRPIAAIMLPAFFGKAASGPQAEGPGHQWADLEAIAAEQLEGADKLPLDVDYRWSDDNAARYAEKAMPYIDHHPNDPRRWEAVMHMIEHPRRFYRP